MLQSATLPAAGWGGAPVTSLPPYRYLTLDIETRDGRLEDAEADARRNWTPDRRWKPETIGARYLEALAKREEKLALLDSAPVCVVSLCSDTELRCLHALYAHAPRQVQTGLVQGYATMAEMLVALRTLLDARVAPETQLVGHNILGFDLCRLRWSYVREGVRMPAALVAKDQPVYDTMREYGKRFSSDRGLMIALDELLQEFQLESHKGLVSGGDVPRLIAEGQHDLVVQYALLDVLAERDLYLRMTGQHGSL